MRIFFVFYTSLFFSLTLFAGGNSKTVNLIGSVYDHNGLPLVGAKVVLVSTQQEVYTNFDGEFSFENLSKTDQKIDVDYVSYQKMTEVISIDEILANNIQLVLKSK